MPPLEHHGCSLQMPDSQKGASLSTPTTPQSSRLQLSTGKRQATFQVFRYVGDPRALEHRSFAAQRTCFCPGRLDEISPHAHSGLLLTGQEHSAAFCDQDRNPRDCTPTARPAAKPFGTASHARAKAAKGCLFKQPECIYLSVGCLLEKTTLSYA